MQTQLSIHNLGRTSLPVTRMGLGLAALGRPGYINLDHGDDLPARDVASMQAHSHTVLDSAWAAGIRYFDAARSYGRAEQFLASWLRQRAIRPDQVTVGSKWGYTYTADWQVEAEHHEIKEHSLPVLQRQIEESRGWLGRHLDLYQIHSATLESGVLDNQAALSELARLRDKGLAIGLSLSGARQAETLEKALAVEMGGRPLFAAVQITWNLLEPSSGPALQAASEAGMGVIVKEALANGRLTSRNDDPAFAGKMALLQQTAAEQQTTIDALALAAVLAQPWATIVLSGAATAEQLQSNVAAFQINWAEELSDRLAPLAEPAAEYWQTRSQLAWN
jgi:aryl-alcohol dehydrogenase-like predicted oxidoreductase